MDPEGNFNYKGRGQRQIFGYAAAIYVFLQASTLIRVERFEREIFRRTAVDVLSYLSSYWKKSEGNFPLTLNLFDNKERIGWYSYHHLTVYNAMVGVWLGLVALDYPEMIEYESDIRRESHQNISYHEQSKVVIFSNKRYFLCISAGEGYYDADTGLALHHLYLDNWGPIVSCPGGPGGENFGTYWTEFMSKNYMAPLIQRGNEILNPSKHVCSEFEYSPASQKMFMKMQYDDNIKVTRTILLEDKGFNIVDDVVVNDSDKQVKVLGINIPIIWNAGWRSTLKNNEMEIINNNQSKIKIKFSSNIDSLGIFCEDFFNASVAGNIRLISSTPALPINGNNLVFSQDWFLGSTASKRDY